MGDRKEEEGDMGSGEKGTSTGRTRAEQPGDDGKKS